MSDIKKDPKAAEAKKATIKRVYGVHGSMRHLFTDDLIPQGASDAKKMEVDGWIEAQVAAGKLGYDETEA